MSIDPNASAAGTSYTGRYYALPLRGRLTPYEGGSFSRAPGAVPEGDVKRAEDAGKKAGFSFAGFLDMINPLQHIPIVSSIYRRITGDEITPVGRIAGDTLFFGVVGLANALANTLLEKVTGKDAGDHVMSAMLGKNEQAPAPQNDAVLAGDDDGVNNTLAATAQPEALRGTVTVIPKGGMASAPLDAATLDALARSIGSAEPLAHLAAPLESAAPKHAPSGSANPDTGRAGALSYNDALIRMQQGLEAYEARNP